MWYPLLWLSCSTVHWSFTALRGRKSDRDKKKKKDGERACVCKENGTGASSPHPHSCCLQSEECCISWGQCRGQGRRGSLLLRSPHSIERGCRHREPAADRNWERTDREWETDGQIETQMSCSIQRDASSVQCSPRMFSFTPSEHRSGNESFSHPKKMRLRVSFLSLDCPLTVLWLEGFVS